MGHVLNLTGTSFTLVAWVQMRPGDRTPNSMILAKHESGYNNGFFLDPFFFGAGAALSAL